MSDLAAVEPLGLAGATLRLVAALVLGGLLGLNRDLHHKPAGLRTHALVSISAAAFLLSALSLADAMGEAGLRMIQGTLQGIITGIGFLGAGVILRPSTGLKVHGLTTAATVWTAAALGVACGAGAWTVAVPALVVVLLVLTLGGPVERVAERLVRRAPDGDQPADT